MTTPTHGMDDGKFLDAGYRKQLESWREATGKKYWTDLLGAASFFFSDKRRNQNFGSDTITKTLRKRPVKDDGLYNLLTLLGLLYAAGGIKSEQEVRAFWNKYEIGYPANASWDELWRHIEEGTLQTRAEIRANSDRQTNPLQFTVRDSTLNNVMKSEQGLMPQWAVRHRWKLILVGGMLCILPVIFFAVTNRSSMSQAPAQTDMASDTISSMCGRAAGPAPSSFLPDQGFSLHEFMPDAPKMSLLSNNVRSIGINTQGLWVGYAPITPGLDGISYLDKPQNQWVHCSGLKLLAGQNVNSVSFKDDKIFLAIDGGSNNVDAPGVAVLTSKGWRLYTRKDRLPSNVVYSVVVDKRGMVWATTYEGVAQLVEDYWELTYYAKPNGLPCSDVHRFIDDYQGNRWFAMVSCGVGKLSQDGKWISYYTNTSGLKNARAIAVDDKNGIWVATDGGGLLRSFNDQWTVFTAPKIPSDNVQDVEVDKFGRIWIATNGGVAYTPDYGQTWVTHSTLYTLGIKFGCAGCAFDENHLWLILKDRGLGHVRIPPMAPTVRFVSIPTPVKLHPGDKYIFEVEVEVLSEGLHKSDGDSLRNSEPNGTDLFGAWPIIEMNQPEVNPGQRYTFSNVKNPIIAPNTPGKYRFLWRVWQGRRFVSAPIPIEFEVIP